MAREVTVRLSADISAYLTAMGQAEQATSRLADTADRLDSFTVSADVSGFVSGMDQASQAADGLSDTADGFSGVEDAATSAAGSLNAISSSMDGTHQVATNFGDSLASVGLQSQDATDAMQGLSEGSLLASSALDGSGTQLNSFSGALESVGTQSQGVTSAMLGVSAGAQGASDSAMTARGAFSQFGSEMRSIAGESRAFGLGLAAIGGGITALLGSVVSTGIAYNTLQQVAGRALETMTGSAEAAAGQMERLHEFADTSPFGRDTWITAQQQLMAFGMEAERVVPTLEGVQNAVAAIGGGDAEIRQLVDILGSVEGQGRITGRELQRMGQMGINAADLMGSALGMTGNEIRTQITSGALDAETAITALADGMNTQFAGAAEGLRDTMEGSLDRIRARIRDIGSVLATPLVDPSGGGFLVEAINQAADFGSALLGLPDIVLQVAGGLTALVGGVMAAGGAWALASDQIGRFWTGAKGTISAVGTLANNLAQLAGGWRNVGIAAAGAVAIFAGLAIFRHINRDAEDVATSVAGMGRELSLAAEGARAFTDIEWSRASESSVNHIDSLSEAFERVNRDGFGGFNDGVNRFLEGATGIDGAITDLDTNFRNMDQSMAQAFSEGRFEEFAAAMQLLQDEAEAAEWTFEEFTNTFPELTAAIQDSANAAGVTVDQQRLLGIATSEAALEALNAGESWRVINRAYEEGVYVAGSAASEILSLRDALSQQAEAARDASEGLSSLIGDMNEYAGVALDAEATTDQWLADLQGLAEVLNEGEFSLNRNTEAGRENRAMLRELAADTRDVAAAEAVRSESLEATTDVVNYSIDAIRRAGEAAGLTADEIDEMIRRYYGFNDVEPIEIQAENLAQEVFNEVEGGLNNLPDDWEIRISALDEDAQEAISALVDGDYEALLDLAGGDDTQAQDMIAAFESGSYQAIADLYADPVEANRVVYDFTNGQYVATADVEGNTTPADQAMAAFLNGDYSSVADILGEDAQARATMRNFLDGQYRTTADINGNDQHARGTVNDFISYDWNTMVAINGNRGPFDGVIGGIVGRTLGTAFINIQGRNVGATAGSAISRLTGNQATGGIVRAPNFSTGGLLPYTGMGTDMIMGLNSQGRHIVNVDDGEFVTRESMTRKHTPALWAINNDDTESLKRYVAGLNSGGVAGGYRPREFAAGSATSQSFDYNRLAGAIAQSGKTIQFNFTSHNPVRQTEADTAAAYTEAVGFGGLPNDFLGDDR